MTLRIPLATALPLLATILVAAPAARAEPRDPTRPSSIAAEPAVRLAQKQDDKEKQRKGVPPKKDAGGDNGQAAKENALQQQQQLQRQQARDKALERIDALKQKQQQNKNKAVIKKQQVDKSRQDTIKAKELQRQARDKVILQKQQADKARQDAIKAQELQRQAKDKVIRQKQQADKARQDAIKAQELQRQAKDKLILQKQQAGKARQDAIKAEELQRQAKDKDVLRKQQADKARQDALDRLGAMKQKQLDAQRAKEAKKPVNPKEQFDALREKIARDKQAREEARRKAPSRKPPEFDRGKADREFEKAREQARRDGKGDGDKERWRDSSATRFEKVRGQRRERDFGSRREIIEPDKRVIVRRDDRTFIRHDESQRLKRVGRELRRERRKNGALMVVTMGLAGALIYTLQDDSGRTIRRSRRGRDGREVVLFDNSYHYGQSHYGPGRDRDYDDYVDLPPPRVTIPRDEYIVDYERASPEELYETLEAPPIEPLERSYSLDEVRQSYTILERMRRVDLDAINFEFGSWDVGPDQYEKLERIARAMQRVLDRASDEVFLIEGHTDAVGSEIDNLSLSDRRAETVAVILTEEFGVPPENLTTQGYGEEHLKVFTDGPSRANRRVSVRRITPLLSREGWDGAERR